MALVKIRDKKRSETRKPMVMPFKLGFYKGRENRNDWSWYFYEYHKLWTCIQTGVRIGR